MNRYCSNCKENYDIPNIKSMADLDKVVCPVCGMKIPANSKKPQPTSGYTDNELKWGLFFQTIYHLAFLFYVAFALIGVQGFLFHMDTLLYIATGVLLIVYIAQFILRTIFHTVPRFRLGVLFIPLGIIAGALIFRSVRGACLGVCVVFGVWHIIRDIFFRLISKLIDLANRE